MIEKTYERTATLAVTNPNPDAFYVMLLRVMNEKDPWEFKKNMMLKKARWVETGTRSPTTASFNVVQDSGKKLPSEMLLDVIVMPNDTQVNVTLRCKQSIQPPMGKLGAKMLDKMTEQMEAMAQACLGNVMECVQYSLEQVATGNK